MKSAGVFFAGFVGRFAIRWRWAAVCLAALGMGVPGTRAGIQFDVFPGYDSIIREAVWEPIVCEVLNDGPTFQAVFELAGGFGGNEVQKLSLDLPTNTRKRFTIPVFGRRYGSWNARLLDERGRIRAEQTGVRARKNVARFTPILGALPRTFSGLPILPEIVSKQQTDLQPAVAHLQVPQFPDNPIALQGLDAIYLNSSKALELNETQAGALLAWIQAGGHVVVGVAQAGDVAAAPWLRSLVPVDLAGSATVTLHGEFDQWLRLPDPDESAPKPAAVAIPAPVRRADSRAAPRRRPGSVPVPQPNPAMAAPASNPYATATPDPSQLGVELVVATGALRGGEAIISSGKTPLVVQSAWGRGRVTILLFDPEREPMHGWQNRGWFWAKLIGIAPERWQSQNNYAWYGGSSIDAVFGAMLDSKQVRKLPIGWLLLLLAAYLAVIGPLDQYVLKKINRQMLTWITFPAYVVLFSLLIYFIGYKLRAGVSEWNEINIVDVFPRGAQAELHGSTFFSVYSPANARYPLASDQTYAVLRGESSQGNQGSQSEIELHGNGFRAKIMIPVWTSQLFVQDWWQSGDLPLTATLTADPATLRIQLVNQLDRPLSELRLVAADRVFELGSLPANQTTNLVLAIHKGKALLDYFSPVDFERMTTAVEQRRAAFRGGQNVELGDLARYASAACFYSQFKQQQNQATLYSKFYGPASLDLSAVVKQGQAVLLAWDAKHAPNRAINQFNPLRFSRDTLFRWTMPVVQAAPAR